MPPASGGLARRNAKGNPHSPIPQHGVPQHPSPSVLVLRPLKGTAVTTTCERIEFQTAAQLVAAIERMAAGVIRLDEMYVKDADGNELDEITLEQETLSDGSVAFNIVISTAGDPNS